MRGSSPLSSTSSPAVPQRPVHIPKTLLVLLGPTAVGKTEIALELAEQLHSPIINADSRQIYRDLRIGTAAPTAEQLARVRHYFVGTLGLQDYYSAARYEEEVLELTRQLFRDHDTLLLSGGSMMYIDAVCRGIDDIPTIEPDVRANLHQRYAEGGLDPLLAELRLLDPEYYAQADLRNTRRIMHALEVCYQTGRPFSSFRTATAKARPFRILKVGLRRQREDLFQRINSRVDQMMAAGFLEEARSLLPYRDENALNTVGYKELFQVLDGSWDLGFAVERIKKNTRVYAKKQMTWFAHDDSIHWLDLLPAADAIAAASTSASSSAVPPGSSVPVSPVSPSISSEAHLSSLLSTILSLL